MTQVTKTYLPDREKFKKYVDQIFDSGWLTNNGQFVRELQERLTEYLGIHNILLVSNGTLALQVAYKLLELKGDVLTTPFSFVATTSSLVWEGLNPVFVDINARSLNLDPEKIESRITSETSAIVATHVYGNACNINEIEKIARKYNLKVIYDAAHAFGVQYKQSNILDYGDVSVISFHSTKTFHTIEGGALVIKDDKLYEKAKRMINFGIAGPSIINGLGINAKMNEFEAAMGLCVLDDFDQIVKKRRERYEYYMQGLRKIGAVSFQEQNLLSSQNYSHFPVIFKNEVELLRVMDELEKYSIYPRRYFHPSLDTLDYVLNTEMMKVSRDISERILCLPMYDSLDETIQDTIIDIIHHITA